MARKIPTRLAYTMVLPETILIFVSVLGALALSSRFVDDTIRARADHDVSDSISELDSHLQTIDSLTSEQLETALTLLRAAAKSNGQMRPNTPEGMQAIVNRIQALTNARATIFQKTKDQRFVRSATTIPSSNGLYAIGTALDQSTLAYTALSSGVPFRGAVYILNRPFVTIYEPTFSGSTSEVNGALFVGFPLSSLKTVFEAINRRRILIHGFTALIDNRNAVVACSDSSSSEEVSRLLRGKSPEGWVIETRRFTPWGYKLVAAYPASDVNAQIRRSDLSICSGGILLLGALVASQFYFFQKKISLPLMEIHDRAIAISRGSLDHPPLILDSANEISNLKQAINQMEVALRERRSIETALESARLAITRDHLTGVFNRAGLEEILSREYSRYVRSRVPFSVLMLDVDHFKQVNDTHGHQVGDDVLKVVSLRSLEVLRGEDVFGRYGGEEFLLIAPGCGPEGAAAIGERVRNVIATTPVLKDVQITISIGIASTDGTPTTLTDLLRNADDALYRAKQKGRNRVEISSQSGQGTVVGDNFDQPDPARTTVESSVPSIG